MVIADFHYEILVDHHQPFMNRLENSSSRRLKITETQNAQDRPTSRHPYLMVGLAQDLEAGRVGFSPADEGIASLTHEDSCLPNQSHDPGQTNSALASVSPSTSSPVFVLSQTLPDALLSSMQMSLTIIGQLGEEIPRESREDW